MCRFAYALALLLSVVDCLQTSGVTRGGSGIQIGTSDRSAFGKATGYGGRGHSGVKLGEARFPNSTRQRPYTTPSTTTTFTFAPPSTDKNGYNSTLKVSSGSIEWKFYRWRGWMVVLSIPHDRSSRWNVNFSMRRRGPKGVGSLIFSGCRFPDLWKLEGRGECGFLFSVFSKNHKLIWYYKVKGKNLEKSIEFRIGVAQ